MPVSKRDKKVSLTKTTKKGMDLKQKLVEKIRNNLEIHEKLCVFTTHNMRTDPMKNARDNWKGSRFFMGKSKVMALALGRTEAEEQHKNLHKVAPFVRGQCGLLLTSRSKEEIFEFFQDYSTKSFARAGFVPPKTIKLEAGPLTEYMLAPSLEPYLRKLGLPTQLEKGKIILRETHVVCTKGVPLTPEQANMLKLLKKEIAEFKFTPLCIWSKDGSFEICKLPKGSGITISPEKQGKSPRTPNKNNTPQTKPSKNSVGPLSDSTSPKNGNESPIESMMDSEEISEEPEHVSTSSENGSESPSESITNLEEIPEEPECDPTSSEKGRESPVESTMTVYEIPDEPKTDLKSPPLGRGNPRKSMRTPKPIKRTPEQRRLSLKKLAESTKDTPSRKSIRSLTESSKGTPTRRSMRTVKTKV